MGSLRLSQRAKLDIVQILEWTRDHFGDNQVAIYGALVNSALREIEQNPLHARSRSRVDLQQHIRTFAIARKGKNARHLIVHRADGGFEIQVLRVLHESMDIVQHLPDEFAH